MAKEIVEEPITGDARVVDRFAPENAFMTPRGEVLPLHEEIVVPRMGVRTQAEQAVENVVMAAQ
jgi:hypothetical protein